VNVIVFGATGATGRLIVDAALSAGHSVTAFVREPGRLQVQHPRLRSIVGDAMISSSVDAAIPGHDAVICALGTMPEAKADLARRQASVPVCSVGTQNIIAAMRISGCRRILVLSSASVGDSYADGTFGAAFIVRKMLGQIMADKELQEAAVSTSDFDWTILRPVRLNDAPAKGTVKSGAHLRWNVFSSATRADVADYLVQSLADSSTFGNTITLRN